MILRQLETLAFSYNEFVWWVGKVVNIDDPNKAGRVKVSVHGYYDEVKESGLPWALCIHPIISAGLDGYGYSPTNIIKGSTVVGFFADGHDALTPIIFATVGSQPAGARPRYAAGEPDVNRLARGVADDNMMPKKIGDLDMGVIKGFGGVWNEPPTPFASVYPKNYVFESKCGHIQEFDGTDGVERINTFHKDGSFEEYHPAGDKVSRVIKDSYDIIHKDKYEHVKGDSSITIDGDGRILIKGDAFIQVKGNLNQLVQGNYKLKVEGDFDTEILGKRTTTVAGKEIYQVGSKLRIEAKSREDMVVGNYFIDVCGNLDMVAGQIYMTPPIIQGASPKCDPTVLPPLFPGMDEEEAEEAQKRQKAPPCKKKVDPKVKAALAAAFVAGGMSQAEADALVAKMDCDAANHGPCWPYIC